MGAVAGAAVGNGGAVVGKLNGAYQVARLTDGTLNGEAGQPALPKARTVFGAV